MAAVEKAYWPGTGLLTGIPRRDRRGCYYEAYIPDPLCDREFLIGGEEAADVSDAEVAVSGLDRESVRLADTEALARLLLRAESISSSKIEGLEVGARRLLRADIAIENGEDPHDITASEVLDNIEATTRAIALIKDDAQITVPMLLEVHRTLLKGTSLADIAGGLRTAQNWIGGSDHNPCSADYIPPPPAHVEPLMEDLCRFCNMDHLPTVAQAAIAHAQFESIHPFADGNGRVGRALIHLVFRRRGLTKEVTPPVSLILATRANDYVRGLQATRYLGPPDTLDARRGLNLWLGTFASACTRAVTDAEAFETRIDRLQEQWRERVGPLRSDSLIYRLMAKLPGSPLITTTSVMRLLDCSRPTALQAVTRLQSAGVLHATRPDAKRNQIYEARELIDLFTSFERQLASPSGNTHTDPPARQVPARLSRR